MVTTHGTRDTKPIDLPLLALGALGVVFGDLGTSPLYTLHAIIAALGGHLTQVAAMGSLSLIIWTLLVTISIKYCIFVMRADSHGEGGILALMSLIGANRFRSGRRALTVMGLLGAALIYGDGVITPSISVLSALEGVNVATTGLSTFVVPSAVVILVILFAVQPFGTAKIGVVFGPVMIFWFVTIALLGMGGIIHHPTVVLAIDPVYAIRFLAHAGTTGFLVLSGVFLCVTGGEALYADIGHFGRKPIRISWYGLVLPALIVNYAGQIGYLTDNQTASQNPFFQLAPAWALYPLIALATVATIIASQAIITGAFSLTRQAIQLGWFPGMVIRQTSEDRYGQIYVPIVNWLMMLATIILTVGFQSSAKLAGAYGTAVSTTMLLTTFLLLSAMRRIWRWPIHWIIPIGGLFLIVDITFFLANLTKIRDGGWIPLTLGAVIFFIMATWRTGIDAVHDRLARRGVTDRAFLPLIKKIPRVPGTAVFLTRVQRGVPALLVQHVKHMGALHESVIELTVHFIEQPRILSSRRTRAYLLAPKLWRVNVRFGFMENPDLLKALDEVKDVFDFAVDFRNVIYFGARDLVVHDPNHARISRWRLTIFSYLFRNSAKTVDRFNLPPENFIEIAREIRI